MKLIKKTDGSLNLRATILSLEPGESLSLKDDQINLPYTRGIASQLGRLNKATYAVSAPKELKGKIIITRQ